MSSVTESNACPLGKQGEILFGWETDSLGTVKFSTKGATLTTIALALSYSCFEPEARVE